MGSEVVVPHILQEYEAFQNVIKGPSFRGTPFDFFGYRDSKPYIIEYKGSLKRFNTPKETQKRRMQKILDELPELHIALLQVRLAKMEYRIFYDDQLDVLFNSQDASVKPILNWLHGQLKCMTNLLSVHFSGTH